MHGVLGALSILGMAVEIVAAFVLSAEAIGAKRLRNIARRAVRARLGIPEDTDRRPSPEALVVAGSLLVTLLATLTLAARAMPRYLGVIEGLLVWQTWKVTFTIMVPGMVVLALIVLLTVHLPRFFLTVEALTERRTAGVVGFSLLLVGFVLQFLGAVGTLIMP